MNPIAFLMDDFLGHAMGGLKRCWTALCSLSPMQIALIVVTLTGITFHVVDRRQIHKLEKHDLATTRALGKEREAHTADIARWKAGQDAATTLNKAQMAATKASQDAITKGNSDAYQAQHTDLRARYAQRLQQHAAAANDPRAADEDRTSGLSVGGPSAPGEAVQSAQPDLLYTAEVELQLNALIDWVKAQHAVDPNAVKR